MKYSNSLKYMCGFHLAGEARETSQKRLRFLCQRLGKVELGAKYICIPGGSAGYATAGLLSSVISEAGYSVGLITSAFDYDPRLSVSVNRALPSIEDFNSSVAALKSAAGRLGAEEYCREEAVFALGLLLCKLNACEYVILQGLSGKNCALDAVCAPYDLIVTPTVCGGEDADEKVKLFCDLIRRGAREVISGNQKSEVYNTISNACALSGARLGIPVKASFSLGEVTARSSSFSYDGRDGFTMKSPSRLLRDVAMTVIEAALALRRGGVKLPWSSISGGLASSISTGCFEVLSVSPLVIIDSASDVSETEMLIETVCEVFGEDDGKSFSVCIPEKAMKSLSALEGRIDDAIILSSEGGEEREEGRLYTVKACAKAAVKLMKEGKNLLCFGSVAFAHELKNEIFKIVN